MVDSARWTHLNLLQTVTLECLPAQLDEGEAEEERRRLKTRHAPQWRTWTSSSDFVRVQQMAPSVREHARAGRTKAGRGGRRGGPGAASECGLGEWPDTASRRSSQKRPSRRPEATSPSGEAGET